MLSKIIVSRIFYFLAVINFLAVIFLVGQRYWPKKAWSANLDQFNTDLRLPVNVYIKDLNLFLPIYTTKLENGDWPTINKGVAFLQDSSLPGQPGNSVFYGHNWPNLLGPLTKAKIGQEIDLQLANKEILRFVITKTELITPTSLFAFTETNEAQLIIYTCTDFFDQNRLIVFALPQ